MKVLYRSVSKGRRQGSFFPWISVATVQAIHIFIQFTRTAGIASLLRIICSASIVVLIIPIIGLFFCLNACYKRFVQWLLTYLYSQEHLKVVFDSRLRTAYDINDDHGIVTAVVLAKGTFEIQEIRERFKSWMCSLKKFESAKKLLLIRFGCYVWKPASDDFNIENHIILFSGKGNRKLDEVTLKQYVNRLNSIGMPSNHPPWQIIVIPLDGPKPSYAMAVRFHHVLATDLFQNSFSVKAEEKSHSIGSPTDDRAQTFQEHVIMAFYTLVYIANCLFEVPNVLVNELMLQNKHLKRRRSSGMESVYWTEPLNLRLLKKMATISGVSTNEILINCITGSLRRYYICMEGYVPEYVISAIPTTTNCNNKNLNGFEPISLPLLMTDTRFRLLHLHRKIASRTGTTSVVKIMFLNYVDRMLPYPIAKVFLKRVMEKYSSVIADYYIPKDLPSLSDDAIKMIYLWRPLISQIGISFSIMYSEDKVGLSVKTDLSSVQRPDVLLSYFIRELKDLAFDLNVREERQQR